MKAAYVFNFIKLVEWPDSRLTDRVMACFMGAEDVLDAFSAATADKTVGTRRIAARSVSEHKSDGSSGCDVLYVDASKEFDATRALGASILTIGDAGDFTRAGGIIRLHMESNRLRFTINLENAKRARLQVSSNLLKLATQIEQGASP